MGEILLKDIHKYYGATHVLKGVNLEVFEDSVVGLIGKNGAGKTTIFKILSEQENYDKGELFMAKGRRLGILDQIPEYEPGTTVYQVLDSAFEDLYELRDKIQKLSKQMTKDRDPRLVKEYGDVLHEFESRGGYTIETSINMVCNGIGIDSEIHERLFSELSGGERTRVNLARIILTDANILLLDEPTNHLDINSLEWLEEYLNSFKGTVVVISHDRYFLDKIAERIIEIEDGLSFSYEGNYSRYAILKEQRRIEQLHHFEQEQKKIKQLEQAIKRMHDWAGRADNAKMHRRAFSMEKRLERIKNTSTSKPKKERILWQSFKSGLPSGQEILTIKGLAKSYDSNIILNDTNLLIKKGDKVALLGNNGAGKSTLLKVVMGEITADAGTVRMGPSVIPAYLPQIVQFDEPEYTILETIRRELIIDEGTARNILAGFLFTGEDVFKKVDSLSGGEKSRLKLCILMQRGVNFLILDEPTNHLDIASREWIEEVLEDFDGTILFVSHDRYLIRKFANIVCELEDKKLYYFDGNYEEYRNWKRYDAQRKMALNRKDSKAKKENTDTRIKRPTPKAIERRLKLLEENIALAEKRMSEIDDEINVNASDYQILEELLNEKKELEDKNELLFEEWMNLQ